MTVADEKNSRTTLFVRNLSKDTTREELSKLFADVGPVKHAIVIHERHGGPSKGFGFVTFALEADAEEAFHRTFEWKGKTLKLDWASEGKKAEVKQKESKSISTKEEKPVKRSELEARENEEIEEATKEDNANLDDEASKSDKEKPFVDWKKRKDEQRVTPEEEEERQRTVILFNLPEEFTDHQLRKRLKKRGGGVVVATSRNAESGLVKVVYDNANTINAAVKEISGREWGGVTVFARRYHQVAHTPATRAKNRLICRNLGFHIKEDELRSAFSAFGPLQEIMIRRGDDGKSKGFGFVQYYCRHDAQKAVEELNGTASLGPKGGNAGIAVDFALAKDRYEALKQKEASQPVPTLTELEDEEEPDEKDEKEAESDDDEEDTEGKDEESSKASDAEDDESEEENEDQEDESKASQTGQTADKGVRDGRTLFVRNLLFETDEQTLRKRFSEFGAVRGVKLIKDTSGRSKGLGFVEFWEKKTCDAALESGEITLEGRVVFVNRAVDKTTAAKLKKSDDDVGENEAPLSKKQKKIQNDKRHLYLAGEGRVSIENVPNADKKKRQAVEDEKRSKLKNPLFFVSPTRLSVKNLNRKPNETLDSKGLKKLFKEAAIRGMRERVVKDDEGDRALFPQGKMPAVRVLKATLFHDVKDDPFSKSSGFAFVEMAHHIHALAALRILNNNPEYAYAAAGGKQAMKLPEDTRPRLIVSFAIENAAKVRAQKLRVEKTQTKNPKPAGSVPSDGAKSESDAYSEDEQVNDKDNAHADSDEETTPRMKGQTVKPAKTKNAAKAKKEKVANPLQQPKLANQKKRAMSESIEPVEKKPKKVRKQDETISNRAFEKQVRKRKSNNDALDEIVAKRSNLFEVPAEQQTKKRWFEE